MFDPVAAVARSVGRPRRRIPVEHPAYGAVAAGVDGDLQAQPVGGGGKGGEAVGVPERRDLQAGAVGIVGQGHGGRGFVNAVHEEFHRTGAQQVILIGGTHGRGHGFHLFQAHFRPDPERQIDAQRQRAEPGQQRIARGLYRVAVHVMDAGNAARGGVAQAGAQLDQLRFIIGHGDHGVDKIHGPGLVEGAGRDAIGAEGHFAVDQRRRRSIFQPGGAQGGAVGEHGVMVEGEQGHRPVGDDGVQMPAGQRLVRRRQPIGEPLAHNPGRLGVGSSPGAQRRCQRRHVVDACQLRPFQPRRPPGKVEMAVDKARQQRAAAAFDQARRRAAQGQRPGIVADVNDVASAHGNRGGPGLPGIDRVDMGADDDQVGGHLQWIRHSTASWKGS